MIVTYPSIIRYGTTRSGQGSHAFIDITVFHPMVNHAIVSFECFLVDSKENLDERVRELRPQECFPAKFLWRQKNWRSNKREKAQFTFTFSLPSLTAWNTRRRFNTTGVPWSSARNISAFPPMAIGLSFWMQTIPVRNRVEGTTSNRLASLRRRRSIDDRCPNHSERMGSGCEPSGFCKGKWN